MRKVKRDLERNFSEVTKTFPQYSNILKEYTAFIIHGWKNYVELSELRKIVKELTQACMENEDFAFSFFKALVNAIYSNIKLLTLPENLLKYLDSILAQRVWLLQPWQTIPVSSETKTLILEILPTDLLLDDYKPIKLGPIKVKGTSSGEIEIAKLFVWGK